MRSLRKLSKTIFFWGIHALPILLCAAWIGSFIRSECVVWSKISVLGRDNFATAVDVTTNPTWVTLTIYKGKNCVPLDTAAGSHFSWYRAPVEELKVAGTALFGTRWCGLVIGTYVASIPESNSSWSTHSLSVSFPLMIIASLFIIMCVWLRRRGRHHSSQRAFPISPN
jgi:hypothetical protein